MTRVGSAPGRTRSPDAARPLETCAARRPQPVSATRLRVRRCGSGWMQAGCVQLDSSWAAASLKPFATTVLAYSNLMAHPHACHSKSLYSHSVSETPVRPLSSTSAGLVGSVCTMLLIADCIIMIYNLYNLQAHALGHVTRVTLTKDAPVTRPFGNHSAYAY